MIGQAGQNGWLIGLAAEGVFMSSVQYTGGSVKLEGR